MGRLEQQLTSSLSRLAGLILEETRGPLWQATQQLCLGIMGGASGDGAGKLDALCDSVIREQVKATAAAT